MLEIESREYKMLVTHQPFDRAARAAKAVWNEIESAASTLPSVEVKGKLEPEPARTISFFDTPDHTLRQNGLVLRRRSIGKTHEWTLKLRSEDHLLAAMTAVEPTDGHSPNVKLEEDIAPPFRCRFSRSATVRLEEKVSNHPQTLHDAGLIFPILNQLHANGRPCDPETPLTIVNNLEVEEVVWKGGKVEFTLTDAVEKAKVALIVWNRGKPKQPVIAELSFRIKDCEQRFSRELALMTRSLYTLLQRLDCVRSDGRTKTEYIYRDAAHD